MLLFCCYFIAVAIGIPFLFSFIFFPLSSNPEIWEILERVGFERLYVCLLHLVRIIANSRNPSVGA